MDTKKAINIKHTKYQLQDWERYEEVRRGGLWNMFSAEACMATDLDRESYVYCMKHYSTLKEQFEKQNKPKKQSTNPKRGK